MPNQAALSSGTQRASGRESSQLSGRVSAGSDASRKQSYEKLKVLGAGSFGKVYKVQHVATREVYVMKRIPLIYKQEVRVRAFEEVKMLELTDHPFVIAVHEHFWDEEEQDLCVIMEYCECGDLHAYVQEALDQKQAVPEADVWRFLTQILSALAYLHQERRIMHRDLKLQNIFLTRRAGQVDVRVGDFGLAKQMQATSELANSTLGTPFNMAPEILEGKPYSSKCDMWALGCLGYELVTGRAPFQASTISKVARKVLRCSVEPLPAACSQALRQLLLVSLLARDPRARPMASELLASRTFQPHVEACNRHVQLQVQGGPWRRQQPPPPSPQSPSGTWASGTGDSVGATAGGGSTAGGREAEAEARLRELEDGSASEEAFPEGSSISHGTVESSPDTASAASGTARDAPSGGGSDRHSGLASTSLGTLVSRSSEDSERPEPPGGRAGPRLRPRSRRAEESDSSSSEEEEEGSEGPSQSSSEEEEEEEEEEPDARTQKAEQAMTAGKRNGREVKKADRGDKGKHARAVVESGPDMKSRKSKKRNGGGGAREVPVEDSRSDQAAAKQVRRSNSPKRTGTSLGLTVADGNRGVEPSAFSVPTGKASDKSPARSMEIGSLPQHVVASKFQRSNSAQATDRHVISCPTRFTSVGSGEEDWQASSSGKPAGVLRRTRSSERDAVGLRKRTGSSEKDADGLRKRAGSGEKDAGTPQKRAGSSHRDADAPRGRTGPHEQGSGKQQMHSEAAATSQATRRRAGRQHKAARETEPVSDSEDELTDHHSDDSDDDQDASTGYGEAELVGKVGAFAKRKPASSDEEDGVPMARLVQVFSGRAGQVGGSLRDLVWSESPRRREKDSMGFLSRAQRPWRNRHSNPVRNFFMANPFWLILSMVAPMFSRIDNVAGAIPDDDDPDMPSQRDPYNEKKPKGTGHVRCKI